ncbi:MAG: LacI family DNA-binding transcriptional regulator [Novosphingobium sp.]|nr:LacI family DNA-binding transcriptional regulator [Novosphingobium sp.]
MLRPTIKDIALRAGVSFKTVSRVLNGYTSVAEDLRLRVEAAMQDLSYRPNQAARQLRGRKAFAIALVPALRQHIDDIGQNQRMPGYLGDVIAGALQACQAADYRLIIETLTEPSLATGRDAFERFLDCTRVDGILLVPPLCDDPWLLDLLAQRRMSVARLNPGTRLDEGYCTVIDNYAAARAVIGHLTAQGHRHIAFIKGPADHRAQAERTRGVLEAAALEDNIRLDLKQGNFLFQGGLEIARELLDQRDRPTAIFAANDEMAAGVLAAAIERGLQVPKDLSIVGFGGLLVSEMTWPRITTVYQPTIAIARELAGLLIAHAGEQPAEPADGSTGADAAPMGGQFKIEPFRLIERNSVAPPQA